MNVGAVTWTVAAVVAASHIETLELEEQQAVVKPECPLTEDIHNNDI